MIALFSRCWASQTRMICALGAFSKERKVSPCSSEFIKVQVNILNSRVLYGHGLKLSACRGSRTGAKESVVTFLPKPMFARALIKQTKAFIK